MALRSKHPHLYGQRIDVGGHIVQIGANGIVTAPAHVEAELLTQYDNWAAATEADMAALPAPLPPAPKHNIQAVLAGQRAMLNHQPVVYPSQMQQLTEDRIVRPGSTAPNMAPALPIAQTIAPVATPSAMPASAPVVAPPLATQLPTHPIDPALQPAALDGPVAPTAAIPAAAPGAAAPPARPMLRGRPGKRADAP